MNTALLVLFLASLGSDGYTTTQNLNRPFSHESNPIISNSNTPERIVYWTGSAGLVILGNHELRKHKHGKLATAMLVAGTALEVGCTIHNVQHYQYKSRR